MSPSIESSSQRSQHSWVPHSIRVSPKKPTRDSEKTQRKRRGKRGFACRKKNILSASGECWEGTVARISIASGRQSSCRAGSLLSSPSLPSPFFPSPPLFSPLPFFSFPFPLPSWDVTVTDGGSGNLSRRGFAVGGSGSQTVYTRFLAPSLLSLLCFCREVKDSSASHPHHYGTLSDHMGLRTHRRNPLRP